MQKPFICNKKFLINYLETLRLDSPGLFLTKICTKEYTLPRLDNQKEGLKIYPGISAVIPIRAIHMWVYAN